VLGVQAAEDQVAGTKLNKHSHPDVTDGQISQVMVQMEKVKSKPGLMKFFKSCPDDVREYFEYVPALVEQFPLDVAIAYVFARVELAHNMTLYCGIAKLHRADTELTYRAVQSHHMTRVEFRSKYEVVYSKPIPGAVAALLTQGEAVRDLVMHGKGASDDQKRNAIAHVLAYASAMNECAATYGGPRPFGDLRGFKGAAQALEKKTTRWVLRGMGFNM
jgi:hypothetical protein